MSKAGTKTDDQLSALCKALAHPARVQIVRFLAKRGSCQTGSLADELPLAQSTVSEHLRILREAGIIDGEIDGTRRCYCINREVLDEMKQMIEKL